MRLASYRISWILVLCLMLQTLQWSSVSFASSTISWGEVQTATYDDLQDTILMYKNELYAGGYVLSTNQTTANKDDADFVINTYGDMGAAGIIELHEDLQDGTDISSAGSFGTSVRLKIGGVYLVSLHDASYAKIRIDRMTASKVIFSYVLEDSTFEESGSSTGSTGSSSTTAPQKEITLEEGGVLLKWDAAQNEVYWDMYRSDNGGNFVRLNDFALSEPTFTDSYAIAGHVYLYQYVAYDAAGNQLTKSPIYKVNVVKKTATNPTTSSGTKITMQINNSTASVNGKNYHLDVPPTLKNGTTMVPLRFVTEAFGAKLNWVGSERKITLTLGQDTVMLRIDNIEAQVNGKSVYMTVPAQMVNSTTLVPIRFVSENLKKTVTFIDSTHQIVITDGNGQGAASSQGSTTGSVSGNNTGKGQSGEVKHDYSFYYHIWQLVLPGVAYQVDDKLITSVGALNGGLLIQSDGTYLWNSTWDGKLIEGKWRETGDAGYPIELINGQEGKNWKVGKANDGKTIYVWDGNSIYYSGALIR